MLVMKYDGSEVAAIGSFNATRASRASRASHEALTLGIPWSQRRRVAESQSWSAELWAQGTDYTPTDNTVPKPIRRVLGEKKRPFEIVRWLIAPSEFEARE